MVARRSGLVDALPSSQDLENLILHGGGMQLVGRQAGARCARRLTGRGAASAARTIRRRPERCAKIMAVAVTHQVVDGRGACRSVDSTNKSGRTIDALRYGE